MQAQSLQYLFTQVKSLNDKYAKLAQLSGENFNIFKILKLHTSEVKLHSNFLAELLNPNGSHGHQDTFLKLFLGLFQFRGNAFISIRADVKIEKYLGVMNELKTEGGRVDILITDTTNRNHIVIENKIYAPDQEKQLSRYNKHYPKADLFYLTLDGRVCEEANKEGLIVDTHYKCLSYKTDIANWLELCRKEAVSNPTLRETITQYLNLIKHLCNQAINDNMEQELSELINNNLEAAFTIYHNLDGATDKLMSKLVEDLTVMAKEFEVLGIKFLCELNIHKQYSNAYFFKEDWEHALISIQLQEYGKVGLIYGIATKKDLKTDPIPNDLKAKLESINADFSRTNWWPIEKDFEYPFKENWESSYEPWEGIRNGTLIASMRLKIHEMIKLIGDLKL